MQVPSLSVTAYAVKIFGGALATLIIILMGQGKLQTLSFPIVGSLVAARKPYMEEVDVHCKWMMVMDGKIIIGAHSQALHRVVMANIAGVRYVPTVPEQLAARGYGTMTPARKQIVRLTVQKTAPALCLIASCSEAVNSFGRCSAITRHKYRVWF